MIAIKCVNCSRMAEGTREYWQEMVEQDRPPLCKRCNRAPYKRSGWTIADVILLAMLDMPDGSTVEDIAVAAWRICPEKMGLRGYEKQYPNNKQAAVSLAILKREYKVEIPSPRSGKYRLTSSGVGCAKKVAAAKRAIVAASA